MPVSVIENASFGNSGIVTANGIKFPATQVASADVNTLDDYEEGTWTPSLFFGGVSGVTTYALRNGTYTKIGNTVTVRGYFSIATKSAATGVAGLEGLPFAVKGTSTEYATASIYMGSNSLTGAPMCYIGGGTTGAPLGQTGVSGVSFTAINNTNFLNNGDMIFQATYLTN
jgi:hypothetical protein